MAEVGGSRDHALVMKSTVPVGTGRSIRRRPDSLGYVSNPEFLKEGTAVADFMKPDRVVVGEDEPAISPTVSRPSTSRSTARSCALTWRRAEMIKLASNAFLATKICFINEIANVSEELGANVDEVARGMGLDTRIGPQFLKAGMGYGGSCLVGEETVLVRRGGRVWMWRLEEMFERIAEEQDVDPAAVEVLHPENLAVYSWRDGRSAPEFLRVSILTRRDYEGPLVQVKTKMGRRVRCTPDHPFVGSQRADGRASTRVRRPSGPALGAVGAACPPPSTSSALKFDAATAALCAGDGMDRVRIRSASGEGMPVGSAGIAPTALIDIPRGRSPVPAEINFGDLAFWRVLGLYLAEGHCAVDNRSGHRRLQWCFHPTKEMHLVEEVQRFWAERGVKADVVKQRTTTLVRVSSQLITSWWLEILGAGANCYEHRVPDQAWDQPEDVKRALLSGLWHGDGSWSLIAGGPSVVLEYGTISRALADGMLRLLADVDLIAGVRVGRTSKSTVDTYWLRIREPIRSSGLSTWFRNPMRSGSEHRSALRPSASSNWLPS